MKCISVMIAGGRLYAPALSRMSGLLLSGCELALTAVSPSDFREQRRKGPG